MDSVFGNQILSLSECVGNTPLVELKRLHQNSSVRILAKLEGNNPAGSVKDRPALWMVRKAEEEGRLKAGMSLVEATSGNTGIALAMIATAKGYPIELIMPANATQERIDTMRSFGATVTLTPAEESMEGAIDLARKRVEQGGAIMLDQFSNPHNPLAHYESTGPEIWEQTGGQVTHFVATMGTTGTIMGCSMFLKEVEANIQIVGVQPQDGACVPGIRRWPKEYLPEIYNESRIDRIIDIGQAESEHIARSVAQTEGLFCGVSAGGALAAAVQLSQEMDSGMIVVIIPDRGDRYLSSGVFSQA